MVKYIFLMSCILKADVIPFIYLSYFNGDIKFIILLADVTDSSTAIY